MARTLLPHRAVTLSYGLYFFLPASLFGLLFPRVWYLVGPTALAAVVYEEVRRRGMTEAIADWLVLIVLPIMIAYMGALIGSVLRQGLLRRA